MNNKLIRELLSKDSSPKCSPIDVNSHMGTFQLSQDRASTMPQLKTKNAFITGAAQGMGKAFADSLLAHGARVVLGDINSKAGEAAERELADKYGDGKVKFIAFDVTDGEKFEEAFRSAVSWLGHVDLLVNNAGIANENMWEQTILINFMAVVRGTQLAIEHMRKDKGGKGGRIVQMSSILGFNNFHMLPVYCGTKSAVRHYTTSLACDPAVKDQGIEYGIICPAMVDTDMAAQLDNSTLRHYDADTLAWMRQNNMFSVERMQESFLKLVLLEDMNGAVLKVKRHDCQFCSLDVTDLGDSWPLQQ